MRNIEDACISGNLTEAFAQSVQVSQLIADTSTAYRSFRSAWSPERPREGDVPDPQEGDEVMVSLSDFVQSVAIDVSDDEGKPPVRIAIGQR